MTLTTVDSRQSTTDNRLTHFKTRAAKGLARVKIYYAKGQHILYNKVTQAQDIGCIIFCFNYIDENIMFICT